ncbi:MAG: zinc ribbon domain-containing protein [Anaerolineales bacterium]|nr:zinc ribbon domain-containing protein [Anaerolineales bacterium]
MEVKFCPKCGASVPENSNFCLLCGINLSISTSSPAVSIAQTIKPIDLEVSTARMKSYTGIAVFVFFLYFFFFFPGLIVNYIYVQEAKKMEEKAGTRLPGVNILNIMLQIGSFAIVITLCLIVAIVVYVFS